MNQSDNNLDVLKSMFEVIAEEEFHSKNPHRLMSSQDILGGITANSTKTFRDVDARPIILDELLKSNLDDKTSTPSNNLTLFLPGLHSTKSGQNPLHKKGNAEKVIEIVHDVFAGQVLGKLGCFINPVLLKDGNLNGFHTKIAYSAYIGEPVCINSILGTIVQLDTTLSAQLYRIFRSTRWKMSRVSISTRTSPHVAGSRNTITNVLLGAVKRNVLFKHMLLGMVTTTTITFDHIYNIVIDESDIQNITSFAESQTAMNEWRQRKAECNEAICHAKVIMSTLLYTFPVQMNDNVDSNNYFHKNADNICRPLYRHLYLFVLGVLVAMKRRVAGFLVMLDKH